MLNPESYKDSAIDTIMRTCESVTPEDATIIGDVIANTLTQFKIDIIDAIGTDCVSGVKERLEQTLSFLRTA